jgi:hypothetical protein
LSDLSTFIGRLSSGQCIILTGAGFSRKATDFFDHDLPEATQLTSIILEELKVPPSDQIDFDLATATSKFMRDTSNDAARLANLVSTKLTCKRTTIDQQKITIQPWYRIFTTNFDNVHERALYDRSSFADSFSRDGSVQPKVIGRQQIVHLHGYVQETNPTVDPARFVLSLESYADRKLHDSAWLTQFRIDARRASAIFAVGFGYSSQDTHLGGLFLTDAAVRSKTAIITHPAASLATLERLSSYGTVFTVGVEGLSSQLPNAPIDVVLPAGSPESLKELTFGSTSANHNASDVDSLLMKGGSSSELINSQLTKPVSPAYFIERATSAFDKVHNFKSHRIVIAHSDIGNGKTIFATELGARLKNAAFRVFEFRPEYYSGDSTAISFLESIKDDTAVIVEDFLSHRSFVDALFSMGRTNILLVLTCRTNSWELQIPSVDASIGGRYREEKLNRIAPKDAPKWIDYLISYGYWKEKASLSQPQKMEFIASKCKGEIRGVLLALLDSPLFKAKLDGYFEKIRALPKAAHELVIYSSFLRFLNFDPNDSYFLSILMNKDYLASLPRIAADSDVYEIISRDGEIAFKSSVFGEYYLREHVADNVLLDLLTALAHQADEKRFTLPVYSDLLRRMLRFSVIRALVHPRDGQKLIIEFFEKNAGLGIARHDPLYWVQYSIARMEDRRFDLCENYISQAYGIARNRIHYDTYQIDTDHARFLLLSRIADYKPDFFDAFGRAHKYIVGVLTRREEDLLYPLQVSQLYLDYFHRFKDQLTDEELRRLVDATDFILEKIQRYPNSLLERNSVGQTTTAKLKETRAGASGYLLRY